MIKQDVYLHSTTPILPAKARPQKELIDWVLSAYKESARLKNIEVNHQLLERFAITEKQIRTRYLECPDLDIEWTKNEIYHLTADTPEGADIMKRNQFFCERALLRIAQSYQTRTHPDHFIHVSCTGYMSPSAPQKFFSQFSKTPDITHAYHMGCYASLPSIRLASALAVSGDQKIDICHNEMCSLHMNLSNPAPEQVVVQSLFADGHITYQVSREIKGFRILGVKERIIPDSLNDMGWIPSPQSMLMNLSKDVPKKISQHVKSFIVEMLSDLKKELTTLEKAIFAIHPGGPKIIEVVKNELRLRDDQISESRKILFERGNMSSATLPHIWHEIYEQKYPIGTPIISLAFGPGLTVFGSVFEVV